MATESAISVVPANQASWEDLQDLFGTGYASRCLCQRLKYRDMEFTPMPIEERAEHLRQQTNCGHPEAPGTSGLVAYVSGEPAGWCAVEPRSAYIRLAFTRVVWAGRDEEKTDDEVWAVVCFYVRTGFRHRGVNYALARAAVDFARQRGARALEGYPMILQPGQEITWDEMRVGNRSVFEAAGFTQVSHPTKKRVVMRIDF